MQAYIKHNEDDGTVMLVLEPANENDKSAVAAYADRLGLERTPELDVAAVRAYALKEHAT